MKFLNAIMAAIGWIVVIAALLSLLGLGSMHMHFGPLDLKFPFRVH